MENGKSFFEEASILNKIIIKAIRLSHEIIAERHHCCLLAWFEKSETKNCQTVMVQTSYNFFMTNDYEIIKYSYSNG